MKQVNLTGRQTRRGFPAMAVGGTVTPGTTLTSGSLSNYLFPSRRSPASGVWFQGDLRQAMSWLRKLRLQLAPKSLETGLPKMHKGGQPHIHALDPATNKRSSHIFIGQTPPGGDFFA